MLQAKNIGCAAGAGCRKLEIQLNYYEQPKCIDCIYMYLFYTVTYSISLFACNFTNDINL